MNEESYPRLLQVAIVGKYNDTDVMKVAANIRYGIDMAVQLARDGFLPICPWLDFQYAIRANLPLETLKAMSMEQVRRSDALLALVGALDSPGALDEIEEANRLSLPVFTARSELLRWRERRARYANGDS